MPSAQAIRSWSAVPAPAAAEAEAAALAPCERGPQAQEANELDSRLMQAGQEGGAAAVLQLVEEEGEHLTVLNVATATAALAAAAPGGGMSPDEIVRSGAFQTLVDMVLAGMQLFEPSLLAQVVHSCGQLGASEEMLLDEIGREIMRHVDSLAAADVARLAAGYAALQHSPSSVLFDSLAARAEAIKGSFTEEQRRQVAQAYEALGYGDKAPQL